MAGWERETRAFAGTAADRPPRWADFADPLDAIAARFAGPSRSGPTASRCPSRSGRALKVLGLGTDADRTALRKRYSRTGPALPSRPQRRRPHPRGGAAEGDRRVSAIEGRCGVCVRQVVGAIRGLSAPRLSSRLRSSSGISPSSTAQKPPTASWPARHRRPTASRAARRTIRASSAAPAVGQPQQPLPPVALAGARLDQPALVSSVSTRPSDCLVIASSASSSLTVRSGWRAMK